MELKKKAMAGTLESSDCMITIEPKVIPGKEVEVEVESIVKTQFGKQIHNVICEVLNEMNVTDVSVSINDKGALDCVIVARLKTAIMRAADEQSEFNWGEQK